MTLRELSQYYYIKKIIEDDEQKIAELDAKLGPQAVKFNGNMPKSSTPRNIVEETVLEMIEAKEKLNADLAQARQQKENVEGYIRSIEDYQVRLIFSYRFICLMSWEDVAKKIGGRNTSDSVRKMCYRFLKKNNKNH